MPAAWRLALRRWRQINRRLRTTIDDIAAPSKNDEYLLYQTLLGAWPLGQLDEAALGELRARIQQYMQKAVREAKVHTSWINPNPDYEAALAAFIDGLLTPLSPNPFLQDFLLAQAHVARYGCLNSLSQILLKLTSPGVPDLYQGTELWDFSLVDPDNRRPVDYGRRAAMLKSLIDDFRKARDPARAARTLLDNWTDGRVKLWLIWRILAWRARHAEWFETVSYLPVAVRGLRRMHICSFARAHRDGWLLSIAPRLCVELTNGRTGWPLGETVWQDTTLVLPPGAPSAWKNVLTGTSHAVESLGDSAAGLAVARVLDAFPVALLATE
jgi:(1->4)-alpha-D-glucan 1-alpha-D-glucosylmutase